METPFRDIKPSSRDDVMVSRSLERDLREIYGVLKSEPRR